MWVQSIHDTINNGITMGNPKGNIGKAAGVNAGVYNQFDKGNSSGVLIRIDAAGTSVGPNGNKSAYAWPSSGSLTIDHTLLRQPIGFKIVDKDKAVDVYRTAPPTTRTITVQPTDSSASVTLYVF
jgi:hypothetical protein